MMQKVKSRKLVGRGRNQLKHFGEARTGGWVKTERRAAQGERTRDGGRGKETIQPRNALSGAEERLQRWKCRSFTRSNFSLVRVVSFRCLCHQRGKHLPRWIAGHHHQTKLLSWIAFWGNLSYQGHEPPEGKVRLGKRSCDKGEGEK